MNDFSDEELEIAELPEREEMFILDLGLLGMSILHLDTSQ
jgi:hypothetical protein